MRKELTEYNFTKYLKKIFEDDNKIEFELHKKTNTDYKSVYYKIIDGLYLQHQKETCTNRTDLAPDLYENIIMAYYLRSGSYQSSAMVNGVYSNFLMKPGDVVRFAGTIQMMQSDFCDPDIESIGIYIYYENLLESLRALHMDSSGVEHFFNEMHNNEKPSIYAHDMKFTQLAEEILSHITANNHFMIKIKSLELLYHCVSNFPEHKARYKTEYIHTIKKIGEEIRSVPEKLYSIQNMACECDMSETHFKKIFTYVFGISPYKYVVNKRLEKAQRLLKSTNLSIQAISETLSFSSPSKFIQAFKTAYLSTPSQYRLKKLSD